MLYIEEIFASLLQLKIFHINSQQMENTAIFHKQTVYVTLKYLHHNKYTVTHEEKKSFNFSSDKCYINTCSEIFPEKYAYFSSRNMEKRSRFSHRNVNRAGKYVDFCSK